MKNDELLDLLGLNLGNPRYFNAEMKEIVI